LSTETNKPYNSPWFLPFLLLSWLHMLFMTFPFFYSGYEGELLSANTLFHLSAWPFYSLFYLIPLCVVVLPVKKIFPGRPWIAMGLALLISCLGLIFIWSDRMVFDLYAFHINRFVLNLVFTEGGIESLNSSNGTYLSVAIVVIRIFVLQGLFLVLVLNSQRFKIPFKCPRPALVSSLFVLLFLVQGVTYGISDVKNEPAVLEHAYDYPFFQKIRFRSLAGKLGMETAERGLSISTSDNSRLHYPLHDTHFDEIANPPNIVWLVAESLRWDQLTPEIMPNTWAFAETSTHFLNHYSSGNGTREGMFGMFYGLYGSYWDSFMHARQSPILMDRLQALGYDFDIRTGAKFTYPEFDKTILAQLPEDDFHEANEDLSPWQRDEENTSAMLGFIEQERSAPFMTFQFFESTHAPYFFPDDHAIKQPYPETLNYADFSKEYLQENISGILNRYRNSGYWVDQQIQRILAALEQEGLMDNTIVIITGDHGEEFMEKGNWGHNSTFVEEQTHVPFVLKLPGQAAQKVSRLTSHLDIATTMLELLGADTKDKAYSLGISLFDKEPREFINISDWRSIAVVTKDMKVRIPYISTGFDYWAPTDGKDNELSEQKIRQLMVRDQQIITHAIENNSLFTR